MLSLRVPELHLSFSLPSTDELGEYQEADVGGGAEGLGRAGIGLLYLMGAGSGPFQDYGGLEQGHTPRVQSTKCLCVSIICNQCLLMDVIDPSWTRPSARPWESSTEQN